MENNTKTALDLAKEDIALYTRRIAYVKKCRAAGTWTSDEAAAREIEAGERLLADAEKRLEMAEAEAAPEFEGKKYYTCRRCSGTGRHSIGVCYGCNGSGQKKTKQYKIFLGEPTDIFDPRLIF